MGGGGPVLVYNLAAAYGWRKVFVILGVAEACVLAPVALLLIRGKPEQFGLLPDLERKNADTDQTSSTVNILKKKPTRAGLANGQSVTSQSVAASSANLQPYNQKIDPDKKVLLAEQAYTLGEAICTAAFWAYALGVLLLALTGTAFWFHLRGQLLFPFF